MAKTSVVTIIFESAAPLELAESLVTEPAPAPTGLSREERREAERIANQQGLAAANAWLKGLHASRAPTSVGYGPSRMAVLRAACLRGLQEFAREREEAQAAAPGGPPARNAQDGRPPRKSAPMRKDK